MKTKTKKGGAITNNEAIKKEVYNLYYEEMYSIEQIVKHYKGLLDYHKVKSIINSFYS